MVVWILHLADPKLLQCGRCHTSLTTTYYQCGNGHNSCGSCFSRNTRCVYPCSSAISDCRAMVTFLASVTIACQFRKFGCEEMISYPKKDGHEKDCKYKSYTCPLAGCNFVSSTELLSLHFTTQHPVSALQFSFGASFSVELKPCVNFLVLQEVKKKSFFVLHRRNEHQGMAIWVSSASPGASEAFEYTVAVGGSLTLGSSTTSILDGVNENNPPAKFLFVPSSFSTAPGEFTLELTLRK